MFCEHRATHPPPNLLTEAVHLLDLLLRSSQKLSKGLAGDLKNTERSEYIFGSTPVVLQVFASHPLRKA